MKKAFFLVMVALSIHFMASTGYTANYAYGTSTSGGATGDWSASGNWYVLNTATPGAIPSASDGAFIYSGSNVSYTAIDGTSTISVLGMGSGNAALTTLNITGGILNINGTANIGRTSNQSNAALNLSGGRLNVNGTLNIGNNTFAVTVGTSASVATFSGGIFSGGLAIGNVTGNLSGQTGKLIVQGTGATISGNSTVGLTINNTGTLGFALDSTGVSLLDYSANTAAGALNFYSGSILSVDASFFTNYGADNEITLIKYANSGSISGTNTFSNLTLNVTGVQTGYTGTIVNNTATNTIDIVFSAVPEPSMMTLVLWGCASGFMLRYRRTCRAS